MLSEGAPKSIYKIKELQDKLAAVKDGLSREDNSNTRFQELMYGLQE